MNARCIKTRQTAITDRKKECTIKEKGKIKINADYRILTQAMPNNTL